MNLMCESDMLCCRAAAAAAYKKCIACTDTRYCNN